MSMLPGDAPRKTPKNLSAGTKRLVKKTIVRRHTKSREDKSGVRYVTTGYGKKNPKTTVREPIPRPNLIRRISNALYGSKQPEAQPITVRIYLDTDDAVATIKVIKAVADVLQGAGYGKTKIENVEKGSIRIRIRAWLDGDDGHKAQQVAKQKLGEAATYAEQWAKDATVNKQRAEVSAINAQTAQTLMESVKDVDNIALQMDEWLIVKYVDATGNTHGSVRKLTVVELQLIERNPGLLNEPAKVLKNLAMLTYGEEHGIAIEG
ncbi:hypothetical protein [Arthrobacter globiformis]|uniref:hypothetical protein n=1 Tax=Arthrobacter globiformis TaxID=1665 RepID=UPI00278CFE14|nr:hypothetical protein [Arthrobacter globiformis]MDQ0618062.1 hypothetical protein [Arthrobacter globiformis]